MTKIGLFFTALFVEPGKSLVVKPAESLLLDVLSSGMPASSFFDTFQDSNFFETEEGYYYHLLNMYSISVS